MIDQIKSEPSIILPLGKDNDTPNWRKKKVRKIALALKPQKEEEEIEQKEK
jgi:hypothetical protein